MKAFYISLGGLDKVWPLPSNDLEKFAAESIDKSEELIVPKDYSENDVNGKENESYSGSSNTTELDFEVTPKNKSKSSHREARFRIPKINI